MESENNALSIPWPDAAAFRLKIAGVSVRTSILLWFKGQGKSNVFPIKCAICVFGFLNGDAGLPGSSAVC